MSRLATWGNELYTGKTSYPFVQKWKTWFATAIILLLVAGGITALRGGFNLGIEFRGGSEFTAEGHTRLTYRNFFKPDQQWQFTGIRLAR